MSRDDRALDQIYREELPYVLASLQRLGAPALDLADLAHDVFITAHHRFETYDPRRPPRPWLFGIALRLMSNYRASAARRVELPGVLPERASEARGPDAQLVEKRAEHLVLALLGQLGEEKRVVLIMADIDGQSAPDIAEQLGIPVNTVYSRLRAARAEFTRLARARGADDHE